LFLKSGDNFAAPISMGLTSPKEDKGSCDCFFMNVVCSIIQCQEDQAQLGLVGALGLWESIWMIEKGKMRRPRTDKVCLPQMIATKITSQKR
jgi:hypothetical protein